jgi:hypothetical protein
MRLAEVFLDEGAKDEYYRTIAYKCVDVLIKAFKNKIKPAYVGRDDKYRVTAAYKGWEMGAPRELEEYFEKFMFFMVADTMDGEHGAIYDFANTDTVTDIITLITNSSSADTYDEEEWRFLCLLDGHSSVKEARITLVHEFIHLLDAHRAQDPKYWSKAPYDANKMRAGDKAEIQKYYNTPVEYNAYVQQELENLDSILRSRASSMDDVKRLIGVTDANSFVTKFLTAIKSEFRKNMTTDTRKKVAKRANQYWQDLERRFSG